jgi:transcriptional regulator with XRE-family HTH domain
MSSRSRRRAADPAKPSSSTTLGANLRRTRLERGLSLRALARSLDVSPSLVSQIETGRIQPSVRTLYAIVSELGVSLDEVFQHEATDGQARSDNGAPEPEPVPQPQVRRRVGRDGSPFVQRAVERSAIDLESGVRWERLTTHDVPGVEFLHVVYPPGSESAPADALVRHSGRELGLVQTGELGVTVGFEHYVLGPGDSVWFESSIPHRLHNDGDGVATAVWIVLGRYP